MRTVLACILSAFCSVSALRADDDAPMTTAQKLFDAMKAHDGPAATALFVSGATFSSVDEHGKVSVTPFQKFIDFLTASQNKWLERIWNPKVLQHGTIAVVWGDYDFHLNNKFSHCGVDSFQLVKINGEWKIQYLIDTRRRQGCE